MFSRVLLPLDGSKRAERALSVGARIARASHGSIVLAQAIGLPAEYSAYGFGPFAPQPPTMTEDMIKSEETNARAYLEATQRSETLKGIPTETKILVGNAAAAIEELAEEERVDLIVMCSHGDTGFKRWLIGSVA
ncbi:MAG TPA: universal stress protein, partial [Ktedonobacteraceae bacterium]|nr:universal stress protein [Ktedonobacteraceae bacterium]